MIRFAWLQARTQTLLTVGALAVVAVVLLITGPHLVHLYNTNIATCAAHGDCDSTREAFLRNDRALRTGLGILVIVVPGIIGLFWGAPLVAREVESGTYRLAWTQSISRTRWLAVKLAIVGVSSMAVAGLITVMVTWWAHPIDTVNANRFSPATFDQRGIVAIGFAAFAFALGVTAGLLIKRTLPAMVSTLVAFVFARVAVIQWIRPHLMTPLRLATALDAKSTGFGRTGSGPDTLQPTAPPIPNAWIYSTHIVDQAGHGITPSVVTKICPELARNAPPPPVKVGNAVRSEVPIEAQRAFEACVTKISTKYHAVTSYQPASRYWAFQWYELAIFLGAALALAGLCFWLVRRRLA